MASFVHFVDGLAGTTQRAFGLAAQLVDAGHSVAIASPVDLSDDAERADTSFVHLDGTERRATERSALARPSRRRPDPRTLARWLWTGRRLRKRSLADREIERVLDAWDPDLVLVDHEFHTAALACRAQRTPFVLVSGVFSTLASASNAPLDTPLVPGRTDSAEIESAWDRTVDANRRARRRTTGGAARLVAPFRPVQLMTSDCADIASFARSRGLRLDDEVTDERWLRPFTISGADTISLTPSRLEWAEPDPAWHTVGLVTAPSPIDRSSPADRTRLDALASRRDDTPGRPFVYASVGTFWAGAESTIRLLVDALGRLDHLDAIVGLGSLIEPGELNPAPNVTLLGWAPQTELLELADLAVVHGGITSIGECLLAGVPMVLASTHTNDQDGTVARAVEQGVAVPVDHRSIDARSLARTIDRALRDDGLRARTRAVSADVRGETARRPAVARLEQMVAAHRTQR